MYGRLGEAMYRVSEDVGGSPHYQGGNHRSRLVIHVDMSVGSNEVVAATIGAKKGVHDLPPMTNRRLDHSPWSISFSSPAYDLMAKSIFFFSSNLLRETNVRRLLV